MFGGEKDLGAADAWLKIVYGSVGVGPLTVLVPTMVGYDSTTTDKAAGVLVSRPVKYGVRALVERLTVPVSTQ